MNMMRYTGTDERVCAMWHHNEEGSVSDEYR